MAQMEMAVFHATMGALPVGVPLRQGDNGPFLGVYGSETLKCLVGDKQIDFFRDI